MDEDRYRDDRDHFVTRAEFLDALEEINRKLEAMSFADQAR